MSKGVFDYIPDIKDKVADYSKVKRLSAEEQQQLKDLEAQRRAINQQIRHIDPSKDTTGKRVARRNKAMEQLMNLSMMNKELKSVGWMNSGESVEKTFNEDRNKPLDKQKYKGWNYDASRDISGDSIPDVIIYDESGSVRGVNGNTIRKSRYPERQLYTREQPDIRDRRAVRDPKTGNPVNFDVDEDGNKIAGTEQYMTKNKFKKDVLYNIDVDWDAGTAEYSHEYARKKIKLTPFKKFSNIIMKHYWTALNNGDYLNEIPKHLKSLFYIKLKAFAWEYMKYWAASQIMKGDYPNNKEERTSFEKQPLFKQSLEQLITEILATDINKTFNEFMPVYNAAKQAVIEGEHYYNKNDAIEGYDPRGEEE